MEIWYIAAIVGALFSGLSNFYFKVAAVKKYNAELFSFYGSFVSIFVASMALVIFPEPVLGYGWLGLSLFVMGLFSAVSGILKIYALRYIDSTIYFPLFKLLAPLLAIVAGVILFGEAFSAGEWFGMAMGLLVPLMLITKSENHRQNNLLIGLLLVLVTGIISASAATLSKFAIDIAMSANITLFYTVLGISAGSLISMMIKKGPKKVISSIKEESSWGLFYTAFMRAALIVVGVWGMLYAFASGGTLAVVQTIHSMYILIPIVLAIIVYKEHWNLQKVLAVVLSVAALALLG